MGVISPYIPGCQSIFGTEQTLTPDIITRFYLYIAFEMRCTLFCSLLVSYITSCFFCNNCNSMIAAGRCLYCQNYVFSLYIAFQMC